MLDAFHLGIEKSNTQIFNTPSGAVNSIWYTWTKPRGVSMLNILCIGGGGGGAGGLTRASGAQGTGGGGGGSSGVTSVLIPAIFVPDVLYIRVGDGGAGGGPGSPSTAGGNGVHSYVAIAPNSTATNVIAISGGAAAVGGFAASSGSGGAGGTACTIATIATMPLAGLGQYQLIAGQVGTAGGLDAAGTAIAIPVTSCLCQAGPGGAGHIDADTAGATFTAIAGSWLSEQLPSAPVAGSTGHGSGGNQIMKPFFSLGGGGGACSNASTGANGGNGKYGSGGGGGGSGTTGGRGGDGGSGIVAITAW